MKQARWFMVEIKLDGTHFEPVAGYSTKLEAKTHYSFGKECRCVKYVPEMKRKGGEKVK